MIRKIIQIDEERCNGCGLCAKACHEGAIDMVDGKARLMRDDYCDGLGDCLPVCPTNAIHFVEREAAAYDEAAVQANQKNAATAGCPGARAFDINQENAATSGTPAPSCLRQWPVQIKLAPPKAPWLNGAHLLIAADCTAYAAGNFHADFIKGRVVLIGCPKLDAIDYTQKLTEIIAHNDLQSITVVRMEVPCCGGIEIAARRALVNGAKAVPLRIVTLQTNGDVIKEINA